MESFKHLVSPMLSGIGMYVKPFGTRLINGWVTIIPSPSLHSYIFISLFVNVCSRYGYRARRFVLGSSSKLPLYTNTDPKAPSPTLRSHEPDSQHGYQGSTAAGGQFCIYQKPKQVTCNVAHMKRVTQRYKYFCGVRARDKVCTGYRWVFGPQSSQLGDIILSL